MLQFKVRSVNSVFQTNHSQQRNTHWNIKYDKLILCWQVSLWQLKDVKFRGPWRRESRLSSIEHMREVYPCFQILRWFCLVHVFDFLLYETPVFKDMSLCDSFHLNAGSSIKNCTGQVTDFRNYFSVDTLWKSKRDPYFYCFYRDTPSWKFIIDTYWSSKRILNSKLM